MTFYDSFDDDATDVDLKPPQMDEESGVILRTETDRWAGFTDEAIIQYVRDVPTGKVTS